MAHVVGGEMRVRVAGRGFDLLHAETALAAAAESVFGEFARGGAAGWTLQFSRGPSAAVAPEMSYVCTRASPSRFEFVAQGFFSGWLDVKERHGAFQLVAPHAWGLSQRNVLRFALILDLQFAGGLVLHAASRAYQGQAYVFSGRSEIGKSTLSRAFPLADFLGDELCFIDEQCLVHRTPFYGEVPAPPGESTAPLAMLLALAQSAQVELTPLAPAAAVQALLATTIHICHDDKLSRLLVDRVLALAAHVPVVAAGFPRFSPGELEPVMAKLAAWPRGA